MSEGNPVFKYMKVANKAHVFKDRKKRKKKGYEKHKSRHKMRDYLFVKVEIFLTPLHQIN